MNVVSRCPTPPFPFPKRGHPREGRRALASDPEVIETDPERSRTAQRRRRQAGALRPARGAQGCGPAARSARLAQDEELADFLCRVQEEIVEEAERLLEGRVAE